VKDDATSVPLIMSLTTRVLVTGGAGFIGSNLAEELIRQGARVCIIDDLSTGFIENLEEIKGDFKFIEGDINDDVALSKAIDGVEVIFHDEPSARAYAASRSGDHRVLAVSVTEFVMGELGTRQPVAWYREGQLQDQRARRPGALYPVEPWSEAARS